MIRDDNGPCNGRCFDGLRVVAGVIEEVGRYYPGTVVLWNHQIGESVLPEPINWMIPPQFFTISRRPFLSRPSVWPIDS